MEVFIETNLAAYGLIAMAVLLLLSGVGIPIGEEMIVIPAGILVATGRFDFVTTAVCAWAAICMADLCWFTLCRRFGTPWLQRPWFKRMIHPRRLLEMKHQLDRRGAWFIVLARFVPSSRTAAITTAGVFRLSYWKFILPTMVCAAITVPLQLLIGWLIGSGLERGHSWAAVGMRIAGVIAVGVLAIALVRWRRHRLYGPRPKRAPMRFLRMLRKRGRAAADEREPADADSDHAERAAHDSHIDHETGPADRGDMQPKNDRREAIHS